MPATFPTSWASAWSVVVWTFWKLRFVAPRIPSKPSTRFSISSRNTTTLPTSKPVSTRSRAAFSKSRTTGSACSSVCFSSATSTAVGVSLPCFLAVHSFISTLAQSDLAAACQVCFLLYELNDHALLRLVIRDLASHDDASNPLAPILSPILRGEVSNRLYGISTPPILASTSSSCV